MIIQLLSKSLCISGLGQGQEIAQKIMRSVMGSAFMPNNVPDQSCMLGMDGCIGVKNMSFAARLCKWPGE